MTPEDVARKVLRDALLKEMVAIDDYIKVTQKRRRELATFRVVDIRSSVNELKGKLPSTTNKGSQSSRKELYQQTGGTSVTFDIIEKEKVDKATKKDQNTIMKDKMQKDEKTGMCCDKAKAVDRPTKETTQEDNIKKQELEKHSDRGKAVGRPTKEATQEDNIKKQDLVEFSDKGKKVDRPTSEQDCKNKSRLDDVVEDNNVKLQADKRGL
nr:uncharacterized protein LOC123774709 [Procambarus clarkii]XP_045625179.1 uncharacterized protein LOC123774709 [Procambarus clarkii]